VIHIDDAARAYFIKLLDEHGVEGTGIRMRALSPGGPKADCRLEFCEPDDVSDSDWEIQCEGFSVYIDHQSAPYLDDTEVCYETDGMNARMVIKAPRLKGVPPGESASLVQRVQYVLETEINPQVASHGGKVSLEEVDADGRVILRFGGGCQGCGMVSVTLREGVEKTLRNRLPEVTAVIDATDHDRGENPYYRKGEAGSSVV
jgi:Fe/S biogenesis protein NfuA